MGALYLREGSGSLSRTGFCFGAGDPSLASLSPQPWVLGAGQGLPAASFLPFLGLKPSQYGVPSWGLSRGGGPSHHPAPQSDSAPLSPPIPGELGPLWEADKWGGGLGWPETSGHSSWTLGACHFFLASHGPFWGCHSTGPGPRSPSAETILGTCAGQAGWGHGGQRGPQQPA